MGRTMCFLDISIGEELEGRTTMILFQKLLRILELYALVRKALVLILGFPSILR
jgi:hypothetical protein